MAKESKRVKDLWGETHIRLGEPSRVIKGTRVAQARAAKKKKAESKARKAYKAKIASRKNWSK